MNDKKRTKRPKWSLNSSFWFLLSVIIISALPVFFFSKYDLWIQLEILCGIVAGTLFFFYLLVLYNGVRFYDHGEPKVTYLGMDSCDIGYEFGSITSGADDPAGLLIAIVLDLLVGLFLTFVFSFLLWLGFNGLIYFTFILTTPVFYVFRTSVRFILKNSKECHHNIMRSARKAFTFTLIKTIWFFLIIAGTHYLTEWYMN
jgi:hypothetical protein